MARTECTTVRPYSVCEGLRGALKRNAGAGAQELRIHNNFMHTQYCMVLCPDTRDRHLHLVSVSQNRSIMCITERT